MFAAHGGKRLIAQQSHGMYAENGSLGRSIAVTRAVRRTNNARTHRARMKLAACR